MEYCVKSTINSIGILPIFINYLFHTDRLTKHLVDQVSADHIGFYKERSGKSDKYGFSLLPAWEIFDVVRHVFFKNSPQICHFKLIFAFKT